MTHRVPISTLRTGHGERRGPAHGRGRTGERLGIRRSPRALPVDVRLDGGAETSDGVLVEAVLDALPSPTVLLAPDGTVVLTNSVWGDAAGVLGDERFRVGIGGENFPRLRLGRGGAPTPAPPDAPPARAPRGRAP